jgi:G6PDH family F420-dependent oxidoreductase
VTCPIMRYHPTVGAQQAATVALLAGSGRFTLGLGAGENLNEHVVGRGWPPANVRHEMFTEAVEIIGELFAGGYVNRVGPHFRVDSARLWDVPEGGVPIAVAVSGAQSVERFAPVADAMVAVEPLPELVRGFDAAAGIELPKIGQQPVAWDSDAEKAVARAHDQFRWFAGGWKVNAELPSTQAFAAASQFVRPDVAGAFACGPDVAAHVESVRPFVDAGFTHVALVQVGGDTQPEFLRFAEAELPPALRDEFGKADDARIAVR